MERIYSEEDLIIPALFELHFNPNGMTTSMLIKALTKNLKPEGADAEILFGRNDTRFSQKVRNLIYRREGRNYRGSEPQSRAYCGLRISAQMRL